VGVHPEKLSRLCFDTMQLLRHDLCSGRELAALLGRWTWAMLCRRPALAIFSSVYRFVEIAGRREFQLSRWLTVILELSTAVDIAPLLYADWYADWQPLVVATDASIIGQGVVAAAVEPERVERAAALAKVVPGNQSPEIEQELSQNPFADLRWSTIVSQLSLEQEHINVKEMLALRTAIRWAVKKPNSPDSRLLVLTDSAVCVAAIAKGRSSSRPLLRVQRQINAMLLACGIFLSVRWIPSASNPADRPSRRIRVDGETFRWPRRTVLWRMT
jgi:hypothetical protein